MPPRSSLTSSFSVTDANNEVVCPLRNQDGSSCRKRCLGVSFTSAQPCNKLFSTSSNWAVESWQQFADMNKSNRRSATDRCKSISDELIPNTTFRSSQLLKRASNWWSIPRHLNDLHHNQAPASLNKVCMKECTLLCVLTMYPRIQLRYETLLRWRLESWHTSKLRWVSICFISPGGERCSSFGTIAYK